MELPPIPITIGSIPHRVTFPDFESTAGDEDGGPSEDNKSKIVSLPQKLQEKFPKLPGVLRGITSTAVRNIKTRWVSYIEYSYNKQVNTKKNKKKKKKENE